MKHIVLGGRANGLGIARVLQREGFRCDVVDLDSRAVCSVSRAVARFHRPEPTDDAVNALMLSLLADGGGVLYSTDDRWNAYIARNRATLQAAGARFPFAGIAAIERVADKLALAQLAADVPETRLYAGSEPGRDWIVKPRHPFTGFEIRKKGAGAGEIEQGYRAGEEFVVQKRLSAPLGGHLSLCGLRTDTVIGSVVYAKALEYPHPGGTSTLSVIHERGELHRELLERGAALLAELDYQGMFEIEFIRCSESGRLFVIDVNLRFWLQHELARLLGIDYANLYRRWLSGEAVGEPERLPGSVAWVHEGFPLSLFSDWRDSLAAVGHLLTRRWMWAHWRWNDPRPFARFLGV
ncbi:hypothetical protein [Lysobacter firmicutimachus]|uniref:ATP-grasp domain-containing protein n=1 Tax=Lysobacter firmicutimachus TaxID=1792846 RepID=A0ABU8CZ89_9GAMM